MIHNARDDKNCKTNTNNNNISQNRIVFISDENFLCWNFFYFFLFISMLRFPPYTSDFKCTGVYRILDSLLLLPIIFWLSAQFQVVTLYSLFLCLFLCMCWFSFIRESSTRCIAQHIFDVCFVLHHLLFTKHLYQCVKTWMTWETIFFREF